LDRDPLSVVEDYFAARDAFDYERARTLLADVGFELVSPILRFDSADAFVQHASLTAGIVQSVATRKVFVDGEDVCHFQTFRIQISEKLEIPIAHWAKVRNGRIVRIEAIFDASVYRDLFPPAT
jgi:ketosteroid isomerase-like protein